MMENIVLSSNVKLIMMATFFVYLVILLGIGYLAELKFSKSYEDFIAAGKSLGAWVTAISASASAESAWVMLGLSGKGYQMGFSAYWAALGCLLGYFINSMFIIVKLRKMSGELGSYTLSDFFEDRLKDQKHHLLRVLSAVIIFFSMLAYVMAQFIGSGKTMAGMGLTSYTTGVLIGGVVIGLYVLMGGYAAVSWTDLLQGLLMVFVLVVFPIIAVVRAGGFANITRALEPLGMATVLPGRNALRDLTWGFIIGQLSISIGYFGMPHILMRFITVKSTKEARRAAFISMTWGLLVFFGSVTLGIAARVLLPNLKDPEKALPAFTIFHFSPIIAGLVLAAITAAIMSTADSQLMYASTALVNDLWLKLKGKRPDQKTLVVTTRLVIVAMALIAILGAIFQPKVIYTFVLYAWSVMGASFAPIVLLSLYWKRFNKWGGLTAMIVGSVVTIVWHNVEALSSIIYELAPAFTASLIFAVIVTLLTSKKEAA